MKTLAELKNLSPEYANIPNGEFAFRVWNAQKEQLNSLEDTLPMGIWADEYNLTNEDFKDMVEFSESAGYDPTDRTFANEYVPEDSQGRAFLQGQTFGFGDEIVGASAAGLEKLISGTDESIEDLYVKYRDREREKMKQFRKAAPGESLAYEVGGAFASPLMMAKGPKGLEGLSAGKQAFTKSAIAGGVYGAGASEEEKLSKIAEDAAGSALTSGIFGLGLQKTFTGLGERVKSAFDKSMNNPTIQTLRDAKNAAYDAVNKSDIRFNTKDFSTLFDSARKIAANNNYTQFKDESVKGALNVFKLMKSEGKSMTLGQLDKVRQNISGRYAKNPEQKALLDMVNAIDDIIAQKASQNPLMEAARIANSRFKKAEKIDEAFYKVGISKLNKPEANEVTMYKDAVIGLLKDKKAMRFFSEEERKHMEQFVRGNIPDRVLQRLSSMSPSSNKLLTALAFAGSYFHPLFLVPTGLGMMAKTIGDRKIKTQAQDLIKQMGGIAKPLSKNIPGLSAVSAPAATQMVVEGP